MARAQGSITGTATGQTASLTFVGGDGANGSPGDELSRWAQWYENGTVYSTNDFDSAVTEIFNNSLHILFATTVAPYPGDADGDGDVDGDDYVILAQHFGTSVAGGPSVGDFNDDGVVNGDDYVILATYFGTHAGGSPSAMSVSVPEPGLPLVPGLLSLGLLRRRRS